MADKPAPKAAKPAARKPKPKPTPKRKTAAKPKAAPADVKKRAPVVAVRYERGPFARLELVCTHADGTESRAPRI